ncbi:MAG: hypothetical protein HFG72_01490 [Hungatella sp.]|jgi:hypothetical protein|nr:hypothetical protein [Hungatella sp.]
MYFLIDFENVLSEGMKGTQYLLEEDTVIIFFSQACEQIQQGCFRQIAQSFCQLDICKLKKTGKNALDFYIATKVGEIFGGGYSGKTAIVSKDQGFSAVKDYWRLKVQPKREVVLGPTLEQCIVSANENRMRTSQIREELKPVKLETEFARYQEQRRMREILEKAFADTGYKEQVGAIQHLLEKQSGKKILYLDSVKTFGKRDGLEIYRRMKRLVS